MKSSGKLQSSNSAPNLPDMHQSTTSALLASITDSGLAQAAAQFVQPPAPAQPSDSMSNVAIMQTLLTLNHQQQVALAAALSNPVIANGMKLLLNLNGINSYPHSHVQTDFLSSVLGGTNNVQPQPQQEQLNSLQSAIFLQQLNMLRQQPQAPVASLLSHMPVKKENHSSERKRSSQQPDEMSAKRAPVENSKVSDDDLSGMKVPFSKVEFDNLLESILHDELHKDHDDKSDVLMDNDKSGGGSPSSERKLLQEVPSPGSAFRKVSSRSSSTDNSSNAVTSSCNDMELLPISPAGNSPRSLDDHPVLSPEQAELFRRIGMSMRPRIDVDPLLCCESDTLLKDCEIVWEGQLIMQAKEAASKMIYLNGSHAIIREAFGAYFADAKQEAIRVKQRMKIVPNMNNTINSLMSGRYAVMLCMAGLVSNASSGDSEISQLEQANAYFKTAFTDYFLAKSCAGVAPLETPNGLFTANVFARGYEFVNHLLSSYSPTLFNHLNTRDISYLLVILNQPDPKTT